MAAVSVFCASLPLPRGRGVASNVPGDCGIGDRPDSRTPPCSGIIGVMSGDERVAREIDGETAGSIFGERMIEALRGAGIPDVELRAETSDDVRLLDGGCG